MIYKEEKRDLFSVPDDYYIAHCISADFDLGAGIALEIENKFNVKAELNERYSTYMDFWNIVDTNKYGDCICTGRIMNLITKKYYYDKPKYDSMYAALRFMKQLCRQHRVHKLAMPKIGCGPDRLRWDVVSRLIKRVFEDTDIEILVCTQ